LSGSERTRLVDQMSRYDEKGNLRLWLLRRKWNWCLHNLLSFVCMFEM